MTGIVEEKHRDVTGICRGEVWKLVNEMGEDCKLAGWQGGPQTRWTASKKDWLTGPRRQELVGERDKTGDKGDEKEGQEAREEVKGDWLGASNGGGKENLDEQKETGGREEGARGKGDQRSD